MSLAYTDGCIYSIHPALITHIFSTGLEVVVLCCFPGHSEVTLVAISRPEWHFWPRYGRSRTSREDPTKKCSCRQCRSGPHFVHTNKLLSTLTLSQVIEEGIWSVFFSSCLTLFRSPSFSRLKLSRLLHSDRFMPLDRHFDDF